MKLIIPILLVTMHSCVNSIQPFVNEDNIIYDKALLGSWKIDTTSVRIENFIASPHRDTGIMYDFFKKPRTEEERKIAAFAAKTYMISYYDKGILFSFEGQLTRIGKNTYLQLCPYSIVNDDSITGSPNYQKGYMIASTAISPVQLTVSFPDGHKLKELILQGRAKLQHEYEPMFNVFAITASTSHLRSFIEKYGPEKSFFPSSNVVILKRR